MIEQVLLFTSHTLRVLKSRKGQSLAEYALVLSFISLLSVVLMSMFTAQLRGVFVAIMMAVEAARSAI